jgi:hypothetical protein
VGVNEVMVGAGVTGAAGSFLQEKTKTVSSSAVTAKRLNFRCFICFDF